jgi:hypothetical protein
MKGEGDMDSHLSLLFKQQFDMNFNRYINYDTMKRAMNER